jgi:hypothetical protein
MMCGGTRQFDMILDKHPVMKDPDNSRAEEFPLFVKRSIVENDVVSLPEARGAADIDQRRYWPYMAAACPSA